MQVREQGGNYEHGGGSSQLQGSQSGSGELLNMLRTSTSRKGKGAKEATMQTRIDTRHGKQRVKLQRWQLVRLEKILAEWQLCKIHPW